MKTNNYYIGSTDNISSRKSSHFRLLKNNNHHSYKLQNDYNKYGKDSFIFELIQECHKNDKLNVEQYYLNTYTPIYNISINSSAPMQGRKHSKKTLDNFKGRKVWNKGIKRTSEEIRNISEGKKIAYKNYTEERKEMIRQRCRDYVKLHGTPFEGKHHTEENKQHLRDLRKSKKKILCENTGEIFEAQIDIAKKYNIKQGHISECLNGKRPSVKGYKFKYV